MMQTKYVCDKAQFEDAILAGRITGNRGGVIKVGDTTFIIRVQGNIKTVLAIPENIPPLACVPSTRTLTRGLLTQDPNPAWLPFSAEAARVILNSDPPAAAKKAGGGMDTINANDPLPEVAPVVTGRYNSIFHPGDTQWNSLDGTTVISWWAGSRYHTSMQVWLGDSGQFSAMPKWIDRDILAGSSLSHALDGGLPYSQQSTNNAEAAITQWAGGRSVNISHQYGVWKNGKLWNKSKPGIAHMMRQVSDPNNPDRPVDELVSVVPQIQKAAGGTAVTLLLSTFSSLGAKQVALQLPLLSAEGGAIHDTRVTGGSWLGASWIEHGFVVMDQITDGGSPGQVYQLYAHFSPDGTQLMVYGVTSGPRYVDPASFINSFASDYRCGQVLVCDVPTTLSTPIVLVHSDDYPPSFSDQTVTESTTNIAFTPDPNLKFEIEHVSWQTHVRADSNAFHRTFWRWEEVAIRCSDSEQVSGYHTNYNGSFLRTTSEMVPFADWAPTLPKSLVGARKIRQSTRTVHTEDKNVTRTRRASTKTVATAYHENTVSTWESNPNYEWSFSGSVSYNHYPTPAELGSSTTTVSTNYIDVKMNGSFVSTYNNSTVPAIVCGSWEDARQAMGLPLGVGFDVQSWPADFYLVLQSVNNRVWTFEGGSVTNNIDAWNFAQNFIDFRNNIPAHKYMRTFNPASNNDNYVVADTFYEHSDERIVTYAFDTDGDSVKGTKTIPEQQYFYALYNTPNGQSGTFELEVTPIWSKVVYLDPRWPMLKMEAEAPYETDDAYGNVYFPGTKTTGVPAQELYTDTPFIAPMLDGTPATAPGARYATITPESDGQNRSQQNFESTIDGKYEWYIPYTGDSWVQRWVHDLWIAAPPPSDEEYLYHYAMSPDNPPVMFGMIGYDAGWPNGWGNTVEQMKPAFWTTTSKRPLGIKGVFGDGVAYVSPVFTRKLINSA